MPTRRSTRLSGGSEAFSPILSKSRTDGRGKKHDDNIDDDRLSGVFQSDDHMEIKSKSKHNGSLFAAKIIDEPRRRSNFGGAMEKPLLPMKKTAMSKPSKIKSIPSKKKTMAPASESEFDNMADMFGTSPMTKITASKPVPRSIKERTPVKPKASKPSAPIAVETKIHKSPVKAKVTKSPLKPKQVHKYEEEIETCDNSERFSELQNRFEKLNMLRTTSAEQLLSEFKKASEMRDQAAQTLIESLRNENALLKDRLESQHRSRRDSNVSMLSVTTTASTSSDSHGMLQLYSNLTGLEMTPLDECKWSCSIEGRHGSYSFELEYDTDAEEYTYTPVHTNESTVWDRLPGYLKEEIVFGEGYLQSFFWRALNFLMS